MKQKIDDGQSIAPDKDFLVSSYMHNPTKKKKNRLGRKLRNHHFKILREKTKSRVKGTKTKRSGSSDSCEDMSSEIRSTKIFRPNAF
jgi:hypothetical protein